MVLRPHVSDRPGDRDSRAVSGDVQGLPAAPEGRIIQRVERARQDAECAGQAVTSLAAQVRHREAPA